MIIQVRHKLVLSAFLAATTLWVAEAQAQEQRASATTDIAPSVQTFKLKNLDVKDAARLIAPYLQSARSGAFEAGAALGVITVRGTPDEVRQAVALLAKYDRPPRTVRLRFQLIEPIQEKNDDPRIRSVSTALRELFDAPGYKLVGEGMVLADESQGFNVTIAAGIGSLHLTGEVQPSEEADNNVGLSVRLYQYASEITKVQPLFSGSLTMVLGNVVVIGSAAPPIFTGPTTISRPTVILVVHPQLETKR